MIRFLLNLALRAASLALLVYCVMSFIMPQSPLYRKMSAYVQPVLDPVRRQLYRWFPALRRLPVDLSPLAVWLLIDVLESLLNLLWRSL